MKQYLLFMALIILAMQLIRPERENYPVDKNLELEAPKEVSAILSRSCNDCHSNQTKWTLASNIAPFMWSIASHVQEGRKALNFSEYKKLDKKTKIRKLERIIQTVKSGIMPLPSYVNYHDEAKLTDEDKKTLIKWAESELNSL